jgi:hypothetical protein
MTNLSDGLVLHLPFSEGSGSKTFDRSKYQNNGTINGPTFVEPFNSSTEGAWLKGWSKRIKITINSSVVDENLTDFPVYLNISTASGIGDVDVSAIFDEVGANSLKIAVTTFSGTQCYVEVVSWDNVGEVAELWVKIPFVDNTYDTIIYIYFDNTHADNSDFVGATNSAVSENVWDTYVKMEMHMDDNPDSSHIMDSSTNDNDGTKKGADEPAEASGELVNCQLFDTDDYIDVADNATLDGFTAFTLTMWVKLDAFTGAFRYLFDSGYWSTSGIIIYASNNANTLSLFAKNNAGTGASGVQLVFTPNVWTHVGLIWDGTTLKSIQNGVILTGNALTGTVDTTTKLTLGATNAHLTSLNGYLDEVNLSSVARSAAWIKARYEAERDDLLTFGSEETYDRIQADWKFGDALAFGNSTDYVTFGVTSGLADWNDFSLSFWIKPDRWGDSLYKHIIDTEWSNVGSFVAYFDAVADGRIYMAWKQDAGGSQSVYTTLSTLNTWYHVVITFTNGEYCRIYINGRLEKVSNAITYDRLMSSNTWFRLGRASGGTFSGLMDEVRIYKRVLTLEEIRLLYLKKVK